VYCCCCRCILHLQQYNRRLNLFFLLPWKCQINNMFQPIKCSSSGPSQRYAESQKAAHTYGIPLVFTSGHIGSAQLSAILYISVMDLMMTTWLVETCCLFDTFMVIKEYCCVDVLSFMYFIALREASLKVYITHTVEHNYISPSSTVGIQLHVSALYVGHLQVVI
jgi:hypothetical protein